jgi:histidinol-phosphate aminotransferase
LQRPSALNSTPRNPAALWLDKNENLDSVLAGVLRKVLESVPQSALTSYPEAGELYRKLARWVGVSPQSLLLTPGSDGAIRLTFEAFVEPRDRVVHTIPTFAMYAVYSQMFGARVCAAEYQRTEQGPRLDLERMMESLREHKPKLLCLPNPDSPTGAILQPDTLRELLARCEKMGTVLLLDEAYHPFYPWSAVPWTDRSANLIVARTFAKAWGAAGLRVGYAVANPATITLLHKMRPMYEVSTLAVEFMSRMIDKSEEMSQAVARINSGKEFFTRAMCSAGFEVLPGEGNFVHVAFGEHADAVHAALSGKVLYRVRSDHRCLAGYSRFSVAPEPIMAQVVALIAKARGNVG